MFEHCLWEGSSVALRLQDSSSVSALTYKQIIDISCDVLSALQYLNSKDHPLVSGLHSLTSDNVLFLPSGYALIKDITIANLEFSKTTLKLTKTVRSRCHALNISVLSQQPCSLILEMLTGSSSKSLNLDQSKQILEKLGCGHPLYGILKQSMEPPPNCPSPAELTEPWKLRYGQNYILKVQT